MSSEMEQWAASAVEVRADAGKLEIVSKGSPGQIDRAVEALLLSGMGDAIGYNEFESAPYVRGVLPWSDKCEVRPWGDSDDSHLLAFLQTNYGAVGEQTMRHAFAIVCERTAFNPVIEAFDELPQWDGVERAGHLLHWFLGAEDSEYTQEVERLLFSGAIVRTYQPGAKFDYMPVLIGAQGCGKSTFARMLAVRDEFFTDSLMGIGTKEGAELVQGSLVVEVGELDAMKGKARETIKAFISRRSDDYRAPYARRKERHPRRFVLVGTTNSNHFLDDPSGNRRFLPVRCGVSTPSQSLFDESARRVFSQAWAEMLHLYRQSENLPLTLSDAAALVAQSEQEEASEDDARIGLIEGWLDARSPNQFVCVSQICEEALAIPRSEQKRWFQTEVREILERHFPEWERLEKKKRVGSYGPQLAYRRKGGGR